MPPDNLPTLVEGTLDTRALGQLLGQDGAFQTSSVFPSLRINYDDVRKNEDGEEILLKRGHFVVNDPDGREVFAKTVKFRPLCNRFQYRRFDPKAGPDGKGATVAKSILVASFGLGGDEPIDDAGGIACGKLRGKAAKGILSAAQQTVQQETKAYRLVWGYVTLDGETAEGEPVSLVDYPVQMRLRGVNYRPIGEVFEALKNRGKPLFSATLTLKTRRENNGGTVYFVIEYEHDPRENLPLTAADVEIARQVLEEIEATNKPIIEKHKQARRKGGGAPFDEPRDLFGGSDLGDDFLEGEAA